MPFFDLETDTHYSYLYDFIKRVADDFELTLLIEKSNSDIKFFDNVKNIKVQKFNSGLWRILENFWLILFIRLGGTRDFYIHYSQISAISASLIARLTGGRTFYWNCGMMWLFGEKRLLGLILKMVTYLVTGVQALVDGYSQHYQITKDKIKIMPNWVDLHRFEDIQNDELLSKYALEPGISYVLFVHRLAKRKGVHYIASIAKQFAGQPNIKFLIVGDGPYRQELAQDIKDLNNVILLGKIANKDIPGLMKISKLFFMPSEEEGFPRVLLEAMASGLPYVAFDIGGVREISTPEQQLYIVDGPANMAVAIGDILKDQSVYDKLREVNLVQVRQFDIMVVKNNFKDLF